jgi:hypothetical protein
MRQALWHNWRNRFHEFSLEFAVVKLRDIGPFRPRRNKNQLGSTTYDAKQTVPNGMAKSYIPMDLIAALIMPL